MRGFKAPHLVLVLFVLFSTSMVLYCLSKRAEVNGKSQLRKDQSSSEGRNLNEVLRRASMPDRTVIVTILNQELASPGSVLDLFLESFRVGEGTKRLLNHLVIFTVDDRAFQYCQSLHPRCFNIATYKINYSTWKPYKNQHHLKLGWRKIELLGEVLELGYNVVFTDADMLWLRNPFPHFDPNLEISIARDVYADNQQSKSNGADGGLFHLKSNAVSIEFFKYWNMARVLNPNSSDQFVFNAIKDVWNLEMRIKYLDSKYFGRFCQSNKDMSMICTVHAKCHNSINRKVHHLRLILDAWRNFSEPSIRQNGLKDSNSAASS